MADLNKLVQSLVKQGSQKEGAPVLPHWIQEGARLCYVSERSGQSFDVIVEGISHSKQQVRFVFESDRKTWKGVPFAQIIAGSNPLRKREAKAKVAGAPAAESDAKDDAERELDSLEAKWSAKAAKAEEQKRGRARSAGPSLTAKLPKAWEQPEILDVGSSPERDEVQDLDAEPPPAPQEPEDPGPYGLGEPALAAQAAAEAAAAGRDSQNGRGRSRSGRGRRRAGSDERDRRKAGKDAGAREEKGRGRQERRSRSRRRPGRSGSRQKAARSRERRKKGSSSPDRARSESSGARRKARKAAKGKDEASDRKGKQRARKRSSSESL